MVFYAPGKEESSVLPARKIPEPVSVRHKSHIIKMMFLTAVARPQPDRNFSGKVAIQRVCFKKKALKSVHHNRGDVDKADCTMDAQLFKTHMRLVMQAVRKKMPWLRGKPVIIQCDEASAHTGGDNIAKLNQEGQKKGWDIRFVKQPTQSPDLNVNDLGFFRSLKRHSNSIKLRAETTNSLYRRVITA